MTKVHILYNYDQTYLEHFKKLLKPGIEVSCGNLEENTDFDILVGGRPSVEDISASNNLRSLIIPFAGLPPETRSLIKDKSQIRVFNLHHNAAATAEMAIALTLACAKNLVSIDRTFRQNDWRPRYEGSPGINLFGKQALILGFGSIGSHLKPVLNALGMTVYGIKRKTTKQHNKMNIFDLSKLETLLPITTVLISALPLTEATRNLVNQHKLSLMPSRAVLVNVGRGEVVNQKDLFTHLKANPGFFAGLDVWYNYPQNTEQRKNYPPADYPFHQLDNIVMSPHRGGGGGSDDIEFSRMEHLANLINSLQEGKPVKPVDLDEGY